MTLGTVLDAALVVMAVAHVVAVVLLATRVFRDPRRRLRGGLSVTAIAFGVGCVTAVVLGCDRSATGLAGVVGASVAMAATWRWHRFRPAGAVVWASFLLMGVTMSAWGVRFLVELPVSALTRSLLLLATAIAAVTLPSSVLQALEGWEVLLCDDNHLNRRSRQTSNRSSSSQPKVSIHVPAHAEPPAVVIATLDALAALDYPDFEVLVIDNNTTDVGLWQPVKRHCEHLGPRFRFFHVEGLTGAKAGALNWALPYTDPAAELLAVVDADYHVAPNWLSDTVAYFDDPDMGFVQCPHAYRDYDSSTFGRMANTEYSVFFATSMVSLSEHGAGLTVGTMSVIRRSALVEAGGWAEWCLTEDSELAIRIHALGYRSVYLPRPYGWGLIPETFAGYKKQRFRWTFGPVQEFRRHSRLFMPGRRRLPSALNARQRLHHANHGLDIAMIGLRLLVIPVSVAAMVSMIWHRELVRLPLPLWVAATAVLVSSLTLRWLVYRQVLAASLREALGAVLAFMALTHVITVASVSASLGRSAHWQRTDKFRPSLSPKRVWHTARTETCLGAGCLAAAAATLSALPHGGVATALALGVAWQGATYLAAPAVALIAHRDLRRQLAHEWSVRDQPDETTPDQPRLSPTPVLVAEE